MTTTSATWTAPLIASVAALGLLVQTAASAALAQESPRTVTITGCIQHLDKTAAAYGAATATTADRPSMFALADAKLGPDESNSKASAIAEVPEVEETKPVGTAGAGAGGKVVDDSTQTITVYQLEGDDKLLASHVGHSVEVTGELTTRPSSSARQTTVGATQWNHLSPKVKVATVKLLASSCSA